MLSQAIVSGIAVGSLYALAALGMVLIYKTSGVVNFAHGQTAMLATFVCANLLTGAGLPFPAAFAGALLFAGLLGALVDRMLIRPIRQAPVFTLIMMTVALFIAFEGVAGFIWGWSPVPFPAQLPGRPVAIGSVFVSPEAAVSVVVACIAVLALFLVLRFTMTGLAMRATAQHPVVARLMGVPVGRVVSLSWAVGSMLGAIAGLLIVPITFLQPAMMENVILFAFAAAVLGGFESLPGTIAGGVLVGVLENLVGVYLSEELKTTFVFLLMVALLYFRPNGLLGARSVKRV